MDCTYYAIPNNNNDFLLLIILGFDSIERKTKLIFIGLLKNENIEAFIYYNNLIFKRKL